MPHRKKTDRSESDLSATAWCFSGPALFSNVMSRAMNPLPLTAAHFHHKIYIYILDDWLLTLLHVWYYTINYYSYEKAIVAHSLRSTLLSNMALSFLEVFNFMVPIAQQKKKQSNL
jgi:hypothetical protein